MNKIQKVKPNSHTSQAFEVHRNPWFHVMNRDGYYTLEYDQPQTVILPIVDDKYILLIKSIRPVLNDTPWELPAGGSEKGEKIIQSIQRELAEEAGIEIFDFSRFEKLPSIAEMPGRMPQLLNIYTISLSIEEYNSRKEFDNSEVVEVKIFTFQEIAEMIKNNKIYISPVCCILSRFLFSTISLKIFE